MTMTLDLQSLLRNKLGQSITAVPCTIDLEALLEGNELLDIDFDLHDHLATRQEVAVVWAVEDVRTVRPDLNDDQAWQVLQECRRVHDCNDGFNWLFIETVAENLYPETPGLDTTVSEEA